MLAAARGEIDHPHTGTLIHDTAASMKLESCLACGLVLIPWMLPQKALIQNLFCSTRVHAFDKWQVYPGRFWVSNDSICSKFEFDPGIQVTSQSLAWHALTGPNPMPNLNLPNLKDILWTCGSKLSQRNVQPMEHLVTQCFIATPQGC